MIPFFKKRIMQENAKSVPATAKVLGKCRTLADDGVIVDITDSEFTMKGLFAADSWHASDGRFEGSIGTPPSLDQGFVLLKKYKSIYQPAEAEENEEGVGRFLLFIQEFMVTSFMKTFRCKHYLPYIMADLEVSQKAAQLVELYRKQSDSSSETFSATQLIAEMGKPSLETGFKLGPQPCSVNISLLQHKASGDSPEFVPSTVMPHLEQGDIEEKLSSRSTSPVMCNMSSADPTSFDRQSKITDFLYPRPCYRGYGILGHQGSESLLNPRPLQKRQKRIKIKHTNVTNRLLLPPRVHITRLSTFHGSRYNNKAEKKYQQDGCYLKPECGTAVLSEDKTQKSTTMQESHRQQARHKQTASSLASYSNQNGNAQHQFSEQKHWEWKVRQLLSVTLHAARLMVSQEDKMLLDSLPEWKDDYHVSSAQEDFVASSGHHHLCEDSSCSPMQLFTEISTLKTSSRPCQAQNCPSTDTNMPTERHKDWSKDQIPVCKSVEAWHDSSVTNAKISEKEANDSKILFVCSSEMDISYDFPQQDVLVDSHSVHNRITQGKGESTVCDTSSENKLVYTVLKECPSTDTALSSSSKDQPCESSRQGCDRADVANRGITASCTADFHQNQLSEAEGQASVDVGGNKQRVAADCIASVLCSSKHLCERENQEVEKRPEPSRNVEVVVSNTDILETAAGARDQPEDSACAEQTTINSSQASSVGHPDVSFTCSSPDLHDSYMTASSSPAAQSFPESLSPEQLSQGFLCVSSQGFEPCGLTTQMLVDCKTDEQNTATAAVDLHHEQVMVNQMTPRNVSGQSNTALFVTENSQLHKQYHNFRLSTELLGTVMAVVTESSTLT